MTGSPHAEPVFRRSQPTPSPPKGAVDGVCTVDEGDVARVRQTQNPKNPASAPPAGFFVGGAWHDRSQADVSFSAA